MTIYKVIDITNNNKVLLETIDKREVDKMLTKLREKLLDTAYIIKVEQITRGETEEFFD